MSSGSQRSRRETSKKGVGHISKQAFGKPNVLGVMVILVSGCDTIMVATVR